MMDSTNNPIQPQQSSSKTLYIIAGIILIAFIGLGSYLLGAEKDQGGISNPSPQPQITNASEAVTQTPTPTTTAKPDDKSLGSTKIYFTDTGKETYLKHSIDLTHPKALYPNSDLRTITGIYSQDVNYSPQKIERENARSLVWTELVNEPIQDPSNSGSILVSDNLFSFKTVPGTKSFLVVEEWTRSDSQASGVWEDSQPKHVLYYYDANEKSGKLTKVQTFIREQDNYAFPKIGIFSPDNRYVSLDLFGCWGCGGHQPETLLVDLTNLKTKNIGRVVEFSWGQNGSYTFKDYRVSECDEPLPGECNKDPKDLPLKTGQF